MSVRSLILVASLALVPAARAQNAATPPIWTGDGVAAKPVYYDNDYIVASQFNLIKVLDTATGKTLWEKKLDKTPDQVSAMRGMVAYRVGGDVSCMEIKTGKPLGAIQMSAQRMYTLGGRVYVTNQNQVHVFVPPAMKPKALGFAMPYVPFTEPKTGVHLGDRVIWPAREDTVVCYDLEKSAVDWKTSVAYLRYAPLVDDPDTPGRKKPGTPVQIFDRLVAFLVMDDELAIHGIRKVTAPTDKVQVPDADFVWLLSAKKGGPGTRLDFEKFPTDSKGAPKLNWSWGSPPIFVARYGHEGERDKFRFDVFINGARKMRTQYVANYNRLDNGAKGQFVLSSTDQTKDFEVVKAEPSLKSMWKGVGRVLATRSDSEMPYHAITGDGGRGTPMSITALDPETGAEKAKLTLPEGPWDPVLVGGHLLFTQPSGGKLLHVDLATLTLVREYALPTTVANLMLLPSGVTVIVQCGAKLCLLSLEVPSAPKKDAPKPPPGK